MRFTRDFLKNKPLRPLILALAGLFALPAFAQNFLQPKVIPTGNWPIAVYSADFNEDGIPDLVYINRNPNGSTTLHVLINDGHSNFTETYSGSDYFTSLAIGNLLGNGHMDIGWVIGVDPSANGGLNGTIVRILGGLGNGQFSPAHQAVLNNPSASVNDSYSFLTAAQLHKTGPMDLIAEDTTNNTITDFQAVQTPASGSFVFPNGYNAATNIALPDGPGPITVLDLNSDGFPDLIVNGQTNFAVDIYLGFSSGTGIAPNAQPTTRFTGLGPQPTPIRSILVQDFDGDGRPDLIAETANGHIGVFTGNGTGGFTGFLNPTGTLDGLTGSGGHLIGSALRKLDGETFFLAATPIGVSSLLKNSTNQLQLNGIYNAGPGPSSGNNAYAFADFNNDGNPDLALDSPEGIAILFGNTDGSFQTSLAYTAGRPAMSSALGAFTSSGNVDAVVSTAATQGQFLHGNGDGTFTYLGSPSAPTPTTAQTGPASMTGTVHVGDFNLDGNLDLAISADGPQAQLPTTGSGVSVQFGDGAGGFSAATPLAVPASPGCSQAAPLYGTAMVGTSGGMPFLATLDQGGLRVFNGDAANPLTLTQNDALNGCYNAAPHNIILQGNLFGKGGEDLLVQYESDFLMYADGYLGTGDGRFTLGGILNDLNGVTITKGQMQPPTLSYPFLGPAVPVSSGGLGFRAQVGSGAIADLDGDGNSDIVLLYANLDANLTAPTSAEPNYIYIWYGSGNSAFLTSAKHPVNPVVLTPSRNFYQVAVADMNGDGIPDLILSDGYILSIQLGNGDGTFGAETHYLAGQGINGISFGDLRHIGYKDLIIANGGALLANPVANKDVLASNPDVNTGGVTVLLNQVMSLLGPMETVSVNPEPSTYGSAFTITAAVTGTGSNPAPTGSVSFYIDGTQASSAITLSSSGVATFQFTAPNTLAIGAHTITAYYSGDNHYDDAQPTITHNVVAAGSVSASPEPSVYGNIFVITATAPGPGTFQFLVDGSPIGSVITTTANTAAIDAPGTYAVGNHSLTVLWFANLSAIAIQITGTHQVVINPTTLSLVLCVDNPGSLFPCAIPLGNSPLISPVTFFYGQSLDGAATESATNLTGSINFYDGTTIFCTISANLQGGANTCPPQSGFFNAGTRTVYAMYTGDANNSPSTSNSIQVIVSPDATTANLTSSQNPAVVGTTLTFTVPITGNYATPTGTVNLYDGSTLIGTSTLVSSGTNTATVAFTNSTLAVGSHTLQAIYNSNPNFSAIVSTISQVITAVVVPPPPGTGFAFTVTPDPVTVGAGATGILLAKVTPQSGATPPPVALSCSNLPDETTCTFVTSTIPSGGGATTLQLHVSAPHDCGATTPYFIGSTDGPASPVPYTFAAVFFGAFAIFRNRKKLRAPFIPRSHRGISGSTAKSDLTALLLILISLLSLASLSGCGHCTDLGTRPGSYTFTVTATPQGASTSSTQTLTIPLTVTIP